MKRTFQNLGGYYAKSPFISSTTFTVHVCRNRIVTTLAVRLRRVQRTMAAAPLDVDPPSRSEQFHLRIKIPFMRKCEVFFVIFILAEFACHWVNFGFFCMLVPLSIFTPKVCQITT
jgi:hypothetical protein